MSQQSISPQSGCQPLRARIIGVGGAGCNVAEHISRAGLHELPVAVVHTNARVLQQHSVQNQTLIGLNRTHGLGSGGDADLARVMAEEAATDLAPLVQDTDLLFVFAGLGGGTGTGVTPVLAKIAKQSGALVIAFIATPFDFEGSRRSKQAVHGLQTLRAAADAVICIPNQKMCKLLDGGTTIIDAFSHTNDLLAQGLRGIWQMLTRPGIINVDFGYLHSVLRGRHTESVLSSAAGEGPERARLAIESLLANPLLEGGKALAEADQVLLSILGPRNLTIAEINSITEQVRRRTDTEEVIIGTALDESLGEKLSLTLIASKGGKPAGALIESEAPITTNSTAGVDTGFLEETRRPAPRFVAPPPEMTPEKTRELIDKQPTGRIMKTATKWKQELLALEVISRGRFEKSEPTIHRGADLDVPTYVRRGLTLN